MWDNTPNQPIKLKTKNWVEINDESRGRNENDNQIRFETAMLRSSSFYYSDAYMSVKGTITVVKETDAVPNNGIKMVIFKNCAPFN